MAWARSVVCDQTANVVPRVLHRGLTPFRHEVIELDEFIDCFRASRGSFHLTTSPHQRSASLSPLTAKRTTPFPPWCKRGSKPSDPAISAMLTRRGRRLRISAFNEDAEQSTSTAGSREVESRIFLGGAKMLQSSLRLPWSSAWSRIGLCPPERLCAPLYERRICVGGIPLRMVLLEFPCRSVPGPVNGLTVGSAEHTFLWAVDILHRLRTCLRTKLKRSIDVLVEELCQASRALQEPRTYDLEQFGHFSRVCGQIASPRIS